MESTAAASRTGVQDRLKELARQNGTDVEGVVAWLASTHSPEDALGTLLA